MPIDILVPRLGWSMDEGTFSHWLKKAGEFVNPGDMLYVLEGDKAAQEVESFDAGILHIPPDSPRPGDAVVVGQRLACLLQEGEPAPSARSVAAAEPAPVNQAPATQVPPKLAPFEQAPFEQAPGASQDQRRASRSPGSERLAATPRARRRARELGVDWGHVAGSGRGGRIRERDVVAAAGQSDAAAPAAGAAGTLQPASRIRRAIAQRLLAAAQQTAPVTLFTKVEASELADLRRHYEPGADVPSYSDILMKFVAALLPQCRELNACWLNDAVYVYDQINIAVAVDTPRGLVAPVLCDVDRLTLDDVAAQSRRLAEQARAGTLTADQLAGGTFTITNLGMFDVDHFTPMIHLPQAAILGVGRVADEPVVADGQVAPGKTLSLSLTFDHRVVDGAPAARWLQRLAGVIRCAADQATLLGGGAEQR